jgi:hypothetical protein
MSRWTWRWYRASHPSRGEKAHLFAPGYGRSFCGYAVAERALDRPVAPREKRCQMCRTGQRDAAAQRLIAVAEAR